MIKSLEKLLATSILIQLLILSNVIAVTGDQPVIASRISEVSEITIITDSGYYDSSKTLFGIKTEVEILNRAEENQTVIELQDLYPRVFINVSFVNQSLKFELISYAHSTIMHYTYQPGITVEYELTQFYINQTGLSQLPDGNYTLWRPINTASTLGYVEPAEEYTTIITVNTGIITIIYHSFYYNYTEEVSSESNNTENNSTNETSFSLTVPAACTAILLYYYSSFKKKIKNFSKSYDLI